MRVFYFLGCTKSVLTIIYVYFRAAKTIVLHHSSLHLPCLASSKIEGVSVSLHPHPKTKNIVGYVSRCKDIRRKTNFSFLYG